MLKPGPGNSIVKTTSMVFKCLKNNKIFQNYFTHYFVKNQFFYNHSFLRFSPISPVDLNANADEPDAVQLWSFSLLAATKPSYCTNGPPSDSTTKAPTGSAINTNANLFSLLSMALLLLLSKLF